MSVIEEAMKQGLEDAVAGPICDPASVDQMIKAGVDNEVTLDLGGKVDMPEIGMTAEPLRVTGKVRAITDGDFVVTVPMGRGTVMSMGKSAVLDTGRVQIVVISRHTEPYDLGCFRSVGIEPTAKRYLFLKSRIHYRAGFAPLAMATITCDGEGVTTSDNRLLRYENVRRPIFPLDLRNEPDDA
jgi:microcystin degradation protein MlrC